MKIKYLIQGLLIGVCMGMACVPAKAAQLPSAYCSDTNVDIDKTTTKDSPAYDCVTSYKKQLAPVCWAFGAISAAESSLLANYPDVYKASSLDLSEYQLAYYTNHLYNNNGTNLWNPVYPQLNIVQFNPMEDMGNDDSATVSAFSAWVGPCAEDGNTRADKIPTSYSKYSSALPDEYATGKTVRQLQNTYEINVYDIDTMKEMIMKYGSGTYCYYSDQSSWGPGSDPYDSNESAMYYSGKLMPSLHEVCIIGWDDNYSRMNFGKHPQKDGAWLVKNSSFPEDKEWISYENVTISTRSTFFDFGSSQAYWEYDFNYQYDSCSGNVELRDNNATEDSVGQMGNIFTAKDNITVKAAGFYTYHGNTDYKIRIYKKNGAMKNPIDGTLVSTYRNTMKHAGYHVVPLTEYAKVKKGEQYSVVVDIRDTEHGNPLVCTGFSLGRYRQQTYSGVSFYRFSDTGDWIDQGGKSFSPYIFRIKAFADASTYQVRISPDSSKYAAVVCNTTSIEDGKDVTFQVIPTGEYSLASLGVLVNGNMVTGSGTYTIRNVDEDIVIRIIDPATTFHVAYDANSGRLTGASSATYTYGTGMTLSTSVEKEGYTFLGWGLDGSYHTSISPLEYGNRTYYAGWKANTYTIRYHSNGGTGSMNDSQRIYDQADKLSANKYSYTGKSFAGWNTKADGTGIFYDEQERVRNLTSVANGTVMLYAQWTSHSYTIHFEANGGEGMIDSREVSYGSKIKLPSDGLCKTGYKFAGWSTKEDGTGTSYSDREEVSNLVEKNGGAVTLYAQWNPITYTIHFDGNGFDIDPKDITTVYDVPVTLPYINSSSHLGYIETGWSTKKNADSEEYRERAVVSNLCSEDGGIVTLYATYRALTYRITYMDAGNNRIDELQYTYGIGLELPANMTKTGYVFEGWYSETDGRIISSITPTMYGERKLVGMWNPASYHITYHTCIPEDVMFEHQNYYYYGDTYTLPTELTAENYTFLGWQMNCRDMDFIMGTNTMTEITAEDYGDIEIYAKWIDENGNLWLPQSMGIYEGSTAPPAASDIPQTPSPVEGSATPSSSAVPETATPSPSAVPETATPSPSAVPETATPSSSAVPETATPDPSAVPETTALPIPTIPDNTPSASDIPQTTSPVEGSATPSSSTVPEIATSSPSAVPEATATAALLTPTAVIDTQNTFTVQKLIYRVTGKGNVMVTGCRNKNVKKITIPATVKCNGVSYRVTQIGNRAFSNKKKLTCAIIGKNVETIGKQAFYKDKKLKKITVKSKKVSKWGKKAFGGISKMAVIRVPAKKKTEYIRIFRASGIGKQVKFKKM